MEAVREKGRKAPPPPIPTEQWLAMLIFWADTCRAAKTEGPRGGTVGWVGLRLDLLHKAGLGQVGKKGGGIWGAWAGP